MTNFTFCIILQTKEKTKERNMFIVFNKEYRIFEAIRSDLLKKAQKSANVEKVYEDEIDAEVYKLDTVDIVFQIGKHIIIARNKSGAEIISLDCHYDRTDELQNAKWKLFGDFLEEVRNIYNKRIEKENKLKEAAAKMKKAEDAKQKVISAQAAKEKMLDDALEKLRGL